jgi:23S rRNA-/tRNA-specific pseudouridylate synthase
MKDRILDLENRIIFEDSQLLVVDKPYDIPTAGKNLEDEDGLQFWLIRREGRMIWVVNQLDADTTGINLFVKEKHLVKLYAGYLKHPKTLKKYLAVVHGSPIWDEIDQYDPIGYIDDRNLGVCADGKPAHSRFRVIGRSDDFSLIEATIFTGRTHQIRIHLSHAGYPVAGDDWYCRPPCTVHHRQALHSWQLELHSNPPCKFTCPPPPDFVQLTKKLNLHKALP